MGSGNLFEAFNTSASGLSLQRARLNVISANIANVQTTRTAEGGPYRRRIVTVTGGAATPGQTSVFEQLLNARRSLNVGIATSSGAHFDGADLARFDEERDTINFNVEIDDTTHIRDLKYVDLFPASQRPEQLRRLLEAIRSSPGHP